MARYEDAEFIDDPTVLQYPIDGIEDVRIIGNICEIVPWTYREVSGVWTRQPSHTCRVETWRIPGMLAVVSRKIGMHAIVSTVDATTRVLRLH